MFSASTRNFQIYSVSLTVFVQLLLVAATLFLSEGNFSYTLDDPYIHLSVSEMILSGGYGVNISEYAAPSSSIIYPFILALTTALGLASLGPAMIALTAGAFGIWFLSALVWNGIEKQLNTWRLVAFFLLGPTLVLSVNGYALPLTGMEHSLHFLGITLVMFGFVSLGKNSARALLLISVGIFLNSFIRFEGVPFAIAGIIGLFLTGYRRRSIALAGVLVLFSILWIVFMTFHDLPILPSSVLTKSSIAASATSSDAYSFAISLLKGISRSFQSRWGVLYWIAVVILIVDIFRDEHKRKPQKKVAIVAAIVALAAHCAAGKYGWWGRYEVYATTVMISALVISTRSFGTQSAKVVALVFPALLFVVGQPYIRIAILTPFASANIYEQQYQMHRFATEFFSNPVAVNDLGWVSYQNDEHVLDLWGLGSEEARKLSAGNKWTPELLDQITGSHGTVYAMIYQDWFKEVPQKWCLVGTLETRQVTSASGYVSFYLIDLEFREEIFKAIDDFSQSLPKASEFHKYDCEAPA